MFGLHGQELIIILLIVLILFGSTKVPEIMKGFGKGVRDFKRGLKDDDPEEARPGRVEAATPRDTPTRPEPGQAVPARPTDGMEDRTP
jgi:sec-independent protein translocase protein TatA